MEAAYFLENLQLLMIGVALLIAFYLRFSIFYYLLFEMN